MRFCKNWQLIISAIALLYFCDFAVANHFLLAKKGENLQVTHFGMVAPDGRLLLPLEYSRIDKLSDNWLWCASTNAIQTIYGDTQFATKLVSSQGIPVVEDIFAQYVDDFPPMLPKKIREDVFYAHLLRGNTPVPVLVYANGSVHEIAPFSHFDVDNPSITFVKVERGFRIFSINDGQAIGPNYEEIRVGSKNAFVKNGGKWNLVEITNGSLHNVLDMEFDSVRCYDYNSKLWVCENGKRQGMVREDGYWVIPMQDNFQIDKSPYPFDGLVKISIGGNKNLFDIETHKIVLKKGCLDITEIARQYAACSIHPREYCLVDVRNGKMLGGIPFCRSFYHPLALWDPASPFWQATTDDGIFLFWIKNGKVKEFKDIYVDAGVFDMRLLAKIKNSRRDAEGVVNVQTGRIIVGLEHNLTVQPWSDKIKATNKNGHVAIMDSQGEVQIGKENHISKLGNLDSSGYAQIVCNGKSGLIDGDCNFVLPCRYEDVGCFAEGLVPVKEGGKWGFVELSGKWTVSPCFEEARPFRDGYAPVRIGGKWGFVGMDGKAQTPFAYEDVKDVRKGHFRAKINGKWGIFALDGTCTLSAEYDSILSD